MGIWFALCSADRVRADGMLAHPAFGLVLSFVALAIIPLTVYKYVVHEAWSWHYLVNPKNVPGLAIALVLVVHAGAVIGGFCLGGHLIRGGRQRVAVYVIAGLGGLLLLFGGVLHSRLANYGSYPEFHSGNAIGLLQVKLGYVLFVLVMGLGAAAGSVSVFLARDSRRVRTR